MKRMKSMISRVICLILAMMMCIATVGCGSEGGVANDNTTGSNTNQNTNGGYDGDNGAGDTQPDDEDGKNVVDTDDYEDNDDGLIHYGQHDYTSPETEDKWLVKDGATQYKLVVPGSTVEADKSLFNNYKKEFLQFFEASTNIVLQMLVDTELPVTTHSADQHYISLGKTSLLKSLDGTEKAIDYSRNELTINGGKIVTVDNNIYLVGNTDRGTLNMVYTFLHITFNWETYSANTTVYDENVTNLKLRNYKVFDIPDTEYQPTSGYEKSAFVYSSDWAYQYPHPTEGGYYYGQRVRTFSGQGLPVSEIFEGKAEDLTPEEYGRLSKPGGHNSCLVFDYKKWGDKYPEWYMTGGMQVCYTAHGDPEKYELMTGYLAECIKRALMERPAEEYPYSRSFDFTNTDAHEMCVCDECSEQKAIYKDSGLQVKFNNDVAEKVVEWMQLPGNEKYRRDDFEIRHYAYLGTESPPAKLDIETGEWVPIDETVIMHPNTCIKYANINTDFQQSLFAEDNKWAKDIFDGWAAVANGKIGYFMYNYNVNQHLYFYDGFDHYNTKGLNYYLAGGRSYYYSENIHGNVPSTWGALISYINAKLCYDSTLDSGKLMDDWFDAVFGDASGLMQEMFRMIRLFNHNETVRCEMYDRFSIYNQVYYRFNWDLAVLMQWIEKADEALASVAYLKETDPDEYDRIEYNVELEVFSPIYIIYNQNLKLSTQQDQAFKARVQRNLDKYAEFRYVTSVTSPLNA
ncbi:MAG: DUF4838 domain-containing protein [Clostridia bacterium]|nr:DUF4838 domain-containing protein [Clostridia bacterium]